jgi:hydroxymethylbilane synthase
VKIRIGTRSSQLALWQAHYVAAMLQQSGFQTELVLMETIGDKILNTTIAKIGSKGVFTEELETALRTGDIDIAVHSAKDMPSELAEDLKLLAFTERENVQDVLVSFRKDIDIQQTNTYVLGTSSTRRVALFKHFYPHLKTVDMRGNLQTRMRKLSEGQCDALVLAYAGVFRMNYAEHIVLHLPLSQFIPAVGQGSVTVECSVNLSPTLQEGIRKAVNHTTTEWQLLAERSFLHTLQGGCSIPSFGLATWQGTDLLMQGGLVSLDGKKLLKASAVGAAQDAKTIGKKVALDILEQGGDTLLKEIKGTLNK